MHIITSIVALVESMFLNLFNRTCTSRYASMSTATYANPTHAMITQPNAVPAMSA